MRKFIDSHMHFTNGISDDIETVVKEMDQGLKNAGIERGIVLHLLCQQWTIEEVMDAVKNSERLSCMVNVDPKLDSAIDDLEYGISKLGAIGLKLHPRIQKFDPSDERVKKLLNAAGEMGVPTLIDAFPDGTALMDGFNPLAYAELAKSAPNANLIWAHFGGHKVMDFMMLAKRLPNVHVDISYSFLYFRDSSIIQDFLYAMKSMKYDRVMYGSDYPDRTISASLDLTREIIEPAIDSEELKQKIFYGNANRVFFEK